MTNDRAAASIKTRLLVVKVGTSTLTRDGGPPDTEYIADLAAQIARQRAQGRAVILVTSGAISAGLSPLGMTERPRSIAHKQAAAAVGQGLLMHSYADAFSAHGLPAAQILLTRDDFRDRARYLNARATIETLLKLGAVPIVNENDTVAVNEIRVGDNDMLAALVASLVDASLLLLLSDIAGLSDKNPAVHADAQMIPVVERIDRSIEELAGGAGTAGGTGGMRTKIAAAKVCARSGVTMVIAHGRLENVITHALDGETGTRFLPDTFRPLALASALARLQPRAARNGVRQQRRAAAVGAWGQEPLACGNFARGGGIREGRCGSNRR